ncbi:tail fiber assembly protein [Roseateles sp.]|jgi:hypothetical protein|uniref:tail fiber assembly protein n=1 Tax=Roseateles sp. TaxID=1971397 RepID=UPI003BA82B2B
MTTWHFYRLADGLFVGSNFTGPADDLDLNIPPGHGAALGVTDWQRQRVDLDTGELMDHEPEGPDLARRQADVRAERDRRLQACDWVVARAMERGEPVPAAWAAYRQALRDLSAQPGFPDDVTWPSPPA